MLGMLHEGTHRPAHLSHLATSTRPATADPRRTVMVLIALVLLFGAAITMWPFVAPLVLAAWAAHLSRPLFRRVRAVFGGRERAAGLLTALLVVVAIAPLALAVMTLIPAAQSLLEQLRGAWRTQRPRDVSELARQGAVRRSSPRARREASVHLRDDGHGVGFGIGRG
jgi:predicted PurR-regulated permease PerM